MVGMKQPKCTICGGKHYQTFCHRKPIKSRSKPIKKPSKPLKAKRRVTKPKKKTRSQLVKELDSVFSKYIRIKSLDENGHATCVTCGAKKPPKEMQNGHFISRGKYPTRWHEQNCHVQDYRCNIALNGNYIEYTLFMIETYGIDRVNELRALSISGKKISTPELREMIVYYKCKVQELSTGKA